MVSTTDAAARTATPAPELAGGTVVGKRYASETHDVEVLATKPGEGTLSIGTDVLQLKLAKPLPASD